MAEHPARQGFWLAAFAAIGFSGKAILVKLAYRYGVDAISLIALRMVFSLPFFLGVAVREARRAGQQDVTRREHAQVAALGIVGYYGASFLDFLGLQHISAGLERVILFLYPTLVILLSWILFRRRISGRDFLALCLSYAGVAAAFAHDLRVSADDRAIALGAALVFGSALAYAVYLVGNGQLVGRLGTARFTAYAMSWACIACIVQFAVVNPLSALALPWQVYAYAAAMAVFCTVMPTFMMSAAIRRLGADRTALVGALGPVATIGLGWAILAEPVSSVQLLGATLVIVGVTLVGRASRA